MSLYIKLCLCHFAFIMGCGSVGCWVDNRQYPLTIAPELRGPLGRFLEQYPQAETAMVDLKEALYAPVEYEGHPDWISVCSIYTDGSLEIVVDPYAVGLALEWAVWHEACHCLLKQAIGKHSKFPGNLMFDTMPRLDILEKNWPAISLTCIQ